jgi:hypothetical protein
MSRQKCAIAFLQSVHIFGRTCPVSHTVVGCGQEAGETNHWQAGVSLIGSVVLGERSDVSVMALGTAFFVDLVS